MLLYRLILLSIYKILPSTFDPHNFHGNFFHPPLHFYTNVRLAPPTTSATGASFGECMASLACIFYELLCTRF